MWPIAPYANVPVDPDGDEARRLLVKELAKSQYLRSQPNWLDSLAAGFLDWLKSLSFGAAGGPPWIVLLIIAIIVAGGVGVAFLVFGTPRRNRRSAVTGTLFGENDDRDAASMRAAAAAAATRSDYVLAVAELYRAIARGLAERTVLSVSPGTTAQEFAVRAGHSFPQSTAELAAAARAFDSVRYLGGAGTRQQYDDLESLERTIRSTTPALESALDLVGF